MAKRDSGAPGPHLIARIEELEQEQQRLLTERKQRQFQFDTMDAHAKKREHDAKASQKRIEQLEREVSSLTKKADEATSSSAILEKQLRTKNEAITYVEQHEAHSKKRLAEAEFKLSAFQKEIDSTKLQKQEFAKKEATFTRDVAHHREALALAESLTKKKDEELSQLQREKRNLQTTLESKETEIMRGKNELVARVNAETGDLKKQIDRVALQTKKERELLERSVEELQMKLRATSDALAAMQSEKNRATQDATIAAQQLADSTRRADKEVQTKEKEIKEVRDAAEKSVATLTAQVAAAERKSEGLAAENQRFIAQIASMKQELSDACDRLRENDAYTEEVFGQLHGEKSKITSLQEELSRVQTRLETEQSAHLSTQAKMKEAKAEHSVSLQNIESSFKDLQQQKLDLDNKLKEATSRAAKSQALLEAKTAEHEKLSFKLEVAEDNLESVNELATNLQARLAQWEIESNKLRVMLEQTQHQLEACRVETQKETAVLIESLAEEKQHSQRLAAQLLSQGQAAQEIGARMQKELEIASNSVAEISTEAKRVGVMLTSKEEETAALIKAVKRAEETERELSAQSHRLQEQLTSLRERAEEAERQTQATLSRSEQLQIEVDEARATARDVQRKADFAVQEKSKEVARLELRAREIEARTEEEARKSEVTLHQERTVAAAQRQALEAEAKLLGDEVSSLERRLQDATRDSRAQITEMETQLKREAHLMEEKLRKSVASLEEQLEKTLAAQVTIAERADEAVRQHKAEAKELQTALNVARAEHDATVKTHIRAVAEIQLTAQSSFDELNTKLASSEEKIYVLSNAVAEERKSREVAMSNARRQAKDELDNFEIKMREKEEEISSERKDWFGTDRQHEEEKHKLRNVIDSASRQTESLQQRLKEAEDEVVELQGQVRALSQTGEESKKEAMRMMDEAKHATAEANAVAQQERRKALQVATDLETAETKLAGAAGQLSELQQCIHNATEAIQRLNAEASILRRELADKAKEEQASSAEFTMKIEELMAELEAVRSKNAKLMSELHGSTDKEDSDQRKAAALAADLERLRDELVASDAQNLQLAQQIADLRSAHESLEAQRASEALKAELKEVKLQANMLTDMLEEGNKAAEEAVQKYEAAEATIQDQRKQLVSLHTKLEALDEVATEIENLRRVVTDAEQEHITLVAEKSCLEEEKLQLKQAITKAECVVCKELENERTKQAEEIASLRAQLATSAASAIDLAEREEAEKQIRVHLRQKEKEIVTMKERDERNQAMLKEKREELQRMVDNLEEDGATIAALKAEVQKLSSVAPTPSRRSVGKDHEAALNELRERLDEAEKEALEAQTEAAEYGDKLTAQMEKNKALASRVQQLELRLSDKRTAAPAGVKTRSHREVQSGDENAEAPAKKVRGVKERLALQENV